jgi:hypothetical protein
MFHLLPSRANLAGFFLARAAGFLDTSGFFGADPVFVDAGTVPDALRSGFLYVISLLSTFLRPFVTSSPLFSSAKTADGLGLAAAEVPTGAWDAGGGGGRATEALVLLFPFETKSLTSSP